MDIHIDEVVSNVRAFDGDALLSPQILGKIVEAVLEALRAQEAHRARVEAERRITGGVWEEQERGG